MHLRVILTWVLKWNWFHNKSEENEMEKLLKTQQRMYEIENGVLQHERQTLCKQLARVPTTIEFTSFTLCFS